ncbi:hypothetical protein EGW08_010561 [Elysia chlorotica]|uniref:Uncharacterized protein n=1 Tax=Elysia chlorotica TaxID=188477 RepID=A0A3S1BIP7_ELYCH|nr:hypothetical protein EGW08_010561 [Elysia chlorotica]
MGMMKATMLTALLLFVAVAHISATRVCGNVFIWRNNNMTCPQHTKAVCADVFKTTRNWYNGTTCDEHRVLHNCMCSGNNMCPVTDDSHKIYASKTHTRFTCQPKCSLGWCDSSPNTFPLTTCAMVQSLVTGHTTRSAACAPITTAHSRLQAYTQPPSSTDRSGTPEGDPSSCSTPAQTAQEAQVTLAAPK